MARTKGAKNKNSSELPAFFDLPTEERIIVIANLIVDRVIEDQQNGKKLERQMRVNHAIGTVATT